MPLANVVGGRISFTPQALRVLLLVTFLVISAFGVGSAAAPGQDRGEVQAARLLFNIPAQPLHEALFAYSDMTGLSVLVDDAVTSGRRSAEVKGSFTVEEALRALLLGTGLEFRYTAANAFTLVPETAAVSVRRDGSRDEAYFHTVQTAVKHVLCSRAETLPGSYRVVVQLWIDGAGVVLRSELLDSTGSRDRDKMLPELLDGLALGEAPPIGLPQPVTMVVLPRPPDVTKDCGPVIEKTLGRMRG
jgi:hypothetical protein